MQRRKKYGANANITDNHYRNDSIVIMPRERVTKSIKVIGVEPASSPLITKGYFGAHKIQGIGANFIPENLNLELIDEIIPVSDDDDL